MEMKLTENFSLQEMCRTMHHVKNVPTPNAIKNLQALCKNVLQPLREYLGEPVVINSGYRCPKLNDLVGGVSNSQHMKGEAADIRCSSYLYAKKIYTWIMDNCEFDQVILENKAGKTYWVHVSYCLNGKNRNQAIVLGTKMYKKK